MSIAPAIEAGIMYSEKLESLAWPIKTTDNSSQSKPFRPGSYSISKDKITLENMKTLARSAVFWRDHDTSRPAIKVRYLPSIQPERPDNVSEEEWDQRLVVGNNYYHLYLTQMRKDQHKDQ